MGVKIPSVETVFGEAIEIVSAAERTAYLDQACGGDAALRQQVESLLSAHARAGDFLATPGASPMVAQDPSPPAEGAGSVIGPYKLLEAIGEGGMGVVYVAEQAEPVRRRVALKVIKPGMDSRQVVARFEAERQALAMMDHPNIARVLDAGMTPAGRPYFVMELVRGLPITDYCDREELTIAERLELFVLVCRAVQHAHQKGVIHRDLKPSNILVTVSDGAAVPKVIDFGIAKATGNRLTDKTLFTGFSQLVGTPLYMSPEQAELAGVDVDTRSDIYSLGVLLYELLTGTTPFDGDVLRRAAFDEMRRIIREDEPPKPSTRLSTLGETLTTTSAKRKADPRRLGKSMRGELDWIVMKALEKDRRRRYETANDFAADVMRHLTDQSVEAYPPSASYRFMKFARRNRVAFTTTIVIATSLLTGGMFCAWQAILANQARRETEGALTTARQAVDEMYTEVAEQWLGDKTELGPLQRTFLEKALVFYEHFAARKGTDDETHYVAASAAERVGNIRARLGLLELAVSADRQALAIRKALVEAQPENVAYLRALIVARDQLGNHLENLGRGQEAEQERRETIGSIERLLEKDPNSTTDRNRLGMSLINQGVTLANQGRGKEAEIALRRSCDQFERLTKDSTQGAPGYQHNLSFALSNLSQVWRESGRYAEAEAGFKKVLEIQRLAADTSPGGQSFIANQLSSLANVYAGSGRYLDAFETYQKATDLCENIIAGHPERHATRHRLLLNRTNQAMILAELQRHEEADAIMQRLVPEAETLNKDYPAFAEYRRSVANVFQLVADQHSMSSSAPDSEDVQLALSLARRAVSLVPESGMAHQSLGWVLYRTGDWKGCVESLGKTTNKQTDFVLAMAHWRLGDKSKARETFNRADDWLSGYEKRWKPTVYPTPTMQHRIRAEAVALLGMKPRRGEADLKPANDSPSPAK